MNNQLWINLGLFSAMFVLMIVSVSALITTAENLVEIEVLYGMHDELTTHVQANRDSILEIKESK